MANRFEQALKNPKNLKPRATVEEDRAAVKESLAAKEALWGRERVAQDIAARPRLIKVSNIVRERAGLTAEERPRVWFPYPDDLTMLEVISSPRGFFSGEIIELGGEPSGGKSTVATKVCARNQMQGGICHWLDFENSRDEVWFGRLGCDYEAMNFYYVEAVEDKSKRKAAEDGEGTQSPKKRAAKRAKNVTKEAKAKATRRDQSTVADEYLHGEAAIKLPPEKVYRIIGAEEVCAQAEAGVILAHSLYPDLHQVIVLDSIAAVLGDKEATAGVENQNMSTKMALTQFMGTLLRRWVNLLPSFNATLILINQVRTKPGMVFGDPTYTPGGRAMEFYPHVRVRVRPMGPILKAGMQMGTKGLMKCYKSKAGGVKGSETGFKLYTNDGNLVFCPVDDVKKEKQV